MNYSSFDAPGDDFFDDDFDIDFGIDDTEDRDSKPFDDPVWSLLMDSLRKRQEETDRQVHILKDNSACRLRYLEAKAQEIFSDADISVKYDTVFGSACVKISGKELMTQSVTSSVVMMSAADKISIESDSKSRVSLYLEIHNAFVSIPTE